MSEPVEQGASPMDTVKLCAGAAIAVAGMAGFYFLPTWPIWARWLLVLVGLVLGFLVALQSRGGKAFWDFIQSSRIELRKVVWRDRDSPPTWQVALLVFVVVALLTLFFWGLDALLLVLTKWLTGRGT